MQIKHCQPTYECVIHFFENRVGPSRFDDPVFNVARQKKKCLIYQRKKFVFEIFSTLLRNSNECVQAYTLH